MTKYEELKEDVKTMGALSIEEAKVFLLTSIATSLTQVVDALEAKEDGERKIGRWINDRYCSNCGWSNEDVYFTAGWTGRYCPNCGVEMIAEE